MTLAVHRRAAAPRHVSPEAAEFAGWLRGLDAFEAQVNTHVLDDFRNRRAGEDVWLDESMGLRRFREKLVAGAYINHGETLTDRLAIFQRFDNDPMDSVRRRMADALSCLLSTNCCIAIDRPSMELEAELQIYQQQVKELEAEFLKDTQARAEAASAEALASASAALMMAVSPTPSFAFSAPALTSSVNLSALEVAHVSSLPHSSSSGRLHPHDLPKVAGQRIWKPSSSTVGNHIRPVRAT